MKISSIVIEGFRGATKKTYTFDNLTYLYGKNGAGKSTIIKALQWALLGYIPGTNKTNSAIFSHANGRIMAVTVKLSDGSTIHRSMVKQSGSISSEFTTTPENLDVPSLIQNLSLPVINFNDFVNMSSNQLKDWWLSFLPKDDIKFDWVTTFNDAAKTTRLEDKQLLADLIKSGEQYKSDTKNFNLYIKQLLSVKKAERAQIDGAIKSLIFYDDIDMNTETSELQNKILVLQSKLVHVNNARKAKADNDLVKSKLSALGDLSTSFDEDEEVQKLKDEEEHINAAIKKLNIENEKLYSDLNEAKDKARKLQKIAESNGICQYTNSKCSSIEDLIESSKSEYQAIMNNAAEIQDRLDKNKRTYNDYVSKNGQLERSIFDKKESYAKRSAYLQCIYDINEDDLKLDPTDIQNEINSLNEEISKYMANQRFQMTVDKLTTDGFIIDTSIAFLKSAEKLTGPNGVVNSSTDTRFDKFSQSVDKYIKLLMGDDVSLKFNNSKSANSFGFGIEKNDTYLPYITLSSGEQCLFAFSLMLAIIDESQDQLKILIIDDTIDHLDDNNAIKFFKSVSNIKDIQVIMAGVKPCSESYAVEVK